jgi:Uncharacterized conserved protein
MPQTIRIDSRYTASPEALWAFAKDFTQLAPVSAGSVTFRGLPTEPVVQGQIVDFEVKPFYARRFKPYRVTMLEVDDANRQFLSAEEGAGVKSWRHRLSVLQDGTGARQIDEIEIDAGLMTPLVALLAKRMYRKRAQVRARLLAP